MRALYIRFRAFRKCPASVASASGRLRQPILVSDQL